ncbi:MAG: hypothetical protein LBC68_10910 [Prevotellaceae bacterium]|jgi:hypothetical protein|nr:hypothetical protein [Prevotellaceae bacterium]
MKTKNAIERAIIVRQIVEQYYEAGNQAKSKIQIYRNVIRKLYPISESTFWRYLKIKD